MLNVRRIRLQWWLQIKINLTPSRHQIHSKTEISFAITYEYSQEYFQPKIGGKVRVFNNILI